MGRGDARHGDVAVHSLVITQSKPVKLFSNGRLRREFDLYLDDVTEAVSRLLTQPPRPDPAVDRAHQAVKRQAPWLLYNVGNSQPVEVNELAGPD